jgi:hypothetical protein
VARTFPFPPLRRRSQVVGVQAGVALRARDPLRAGRVGAGRGRSSGCRAWQGATVSRAPPARRLPGHAAMRLRPPPAARRAPPRRAPALRRGRRWTGSRRSAGSAAPRALRGGRMGTQPLCMREGRGRRGERADRRGAWPRPPMRGPQGGGVDQQRRRRREARRRLGRRGRMCWLVGRRHPRSPPSWAPDSQSCAKGFVHGSTWGSQRGITGRGRVRRGRRGLARRCSSSPAAGARARPAGAGPAPPPHLVVEHQPLRIEPGGVAGPQGRRVVQHLAPARPRAWHAPARCGPRGLPNRRPPKKSSSRVETFAGATV